MTLINGGELVVRTLKSVGVDTIFGLHGAHIDTIFQACSDNDVNIVDARHEAAAGHAAEGYARTSRDLGVALVTAGGGLTNVVTPMANALMDRTPLLVLTGSGPLDKDETNDLQAGIDQVAIATPVTKWAHRVTRTELIPRLLAQAIRIATTAPRGPVLLDLPWDVLMGQSEDDLLAQAASAVSALGGAPATNDLQASLDILRDAERPVIVVGSEAKWAKEDAALAALAANIGAPVFADFEGMSALGEVPDEQAGGLVQNLFGFGAADALPDAVLMLGLRFGLLTQHGSGKLIPHSAKIVQIDPDARELGRLQPIALGIQADIGASIAMLAERSAADPVDGSAWIKQADDIVNQRFEGVNANIDDDTPLHPLVACQTIAKHITRDTTIVADGALTYMWLGEVISKARPANYVCHGYFGSMGVGFGTSVGTGVASLPKDPVILVTGDGAAGYNFTELDTMVRNNVPVVVVIMNNQSWGATQHFQKIVLGDNRVTKTMLQNGDYFAAAQAFGANGYLATTKEELDTALADALASKKPACIDVRIRLDTIPPEEMIMMGQNPF